MKLIGEVSKRTSFEMDFDYLRTGSNVIYFYKKSWDHYIGELIFLPDICRWHLKTFNPKEQVDTYKEKIMNNWTVKEV